LESNHTTSRKEMKHIGTISVVLSALLLIAMPSISLWLIAFGKNGSLLNLYWTTFGVITFETAVIYSYYKLRKIS
jgi:hypothetical protein